LDEFDVIIQNVNIVEGTGKSPYRGNIGIREDKIHELGNFLGDSKKVINGENLTALPGFIDAHSHADWNLLWFPNCESYVLQGVTMFIGGQCGGSMAPINEYYKMPPMLGDHFFDIKPYKYYPEKELFTIEEINEWMNSIFGWEIKWRTMNGFFEEVEKTGISMNYAPLVGHGTIRNCVMGMDYKRNSTKSEQEEMHEYIRQAIEDGCIGMSTGLDYDPDVFASHEEIIESVRVLNDYDVIYSPHWRRTGRRRDVKVGHIPNEKITALMDCVKVHKETGVRLHFAHLLPGWDVYPPGFEDMERDNLKNTIKMITSDAKTDLDITWNTILFTIRGGFAVMPYLCSLLEPWLRELGGPEKLGEWLNVEEIREEINEAILSGKWYIRENTNPAVNPRWSENVFVVKSRSSNLDGKSIRQIAEERDHDPWETYLDIISEDPYTRGVTGGSGNSTGGRQSYYNEHYLNPRGVLSLDTLVYNKEYQGKNPPYKIPGINTFSAYPLFFIQFVMDEKIFTLDEAVQRTSAKTAMIHNLEGRGIIDEGSFADIVLMDLENLEVIGNEYEPRKYPKGIEYVIVNGKIVVERGKHLGTRPGKVIRRSN
jgi:N-acyl-D-aspartate/D-glutamate deacylase